MAYKAHTEEPKRKQVGKDHFEETHPAYAQIGASRVSGETYLYGSDFKHRHYVTIRISESSMQRSLSRDWYHAGNEYIEVELSEAQWAAFVSSMNMGDGVPCTLRRRDGILVPEVSPPPDRKAQFSAEMRECLATVQAETATLRRKIEAGVIPRKMKEDLLDTLIQVENHLTPNVTFVADSFGKHVEQVTERAKTEVSAHIQSVLVRAGIEALRDGKHPVELPGSDEKSAEIGQK